MMRAYVAGLALTLVAGNPAWAGWGIVPDTEDGVAPKQMPCAPREMFVKLPFDDLVTQDATGALRAQSPDRIWDAIVRIARSDRYEAPGTTLPEAPVGIGCATLGVTQGVPQVAVRPYFTSSSRSPDKLPAWVPDGWRSPGNRKLLDWDRGGQPLLDLHAAVVHALGVALAGHRPEVLWVDIGSFGDHGEWQLNGRRLVAASVATRQAIIQHYLDAFPGTAAAPIPLSIAFDAMLKTGSDGDGRDTPIYELLRQEHRIGVRFDCLGERSFTEPYARVLDSTFDFAAFAGPWGGEMCHSSRAARAVFGRAGDDDEPSRPRRRFDSRDAVFALIEDCHWSFLATAGSVLLQKPMASRKNVVPRVKRLQTALIDTPVGVVDRSKCADTLANHWPPTDP